MEFRIADTFTGSLARLTGDEQKAVKTTAFDLQLNPANPGMSFHKLDKAKDKDFWSVRVSSDIRLIVHRSAASLLLCYVGHHDDAYDWAERRKLETHPKTGAAQLVEIRETVKEIVVPVYVLTETTAPPKSPTETKPIFAERSDDELLGYGVPAEWLKDVKAATEDTLLVLADHLPAEAAEALLELATGGTPRVPPLPVPSATPFDHPDAQRRFRTVASVEELERALDSPWEKWTVFLHPDQRDTVERNYAGPARVSGSAGTGKTIAALHRAVHLARTNPESRVLLTTFSDTLANALRPKLRRLLGNEPRLGERIDLYSLNAIGLRLYKSYIGEVTIGGDDIVRELVREAANSVGGHSFAQRFLVSEWEQVVDAWQLQEWEAYRDVARLGRKTRLPEAQRKVLWSILGRVRAGLKSRNLMTYPALFTALAAVIGKRTVPFDFAVVDEAQDIGVAHIKFFAALGGLASSLLAGFVRHQLVAHAQPGCPASQEGTGCATRNDGNLEDQERGVRLCGVDEAQDVSIAHVRFLAALGDGRPDALFFAGDLGQRIFQQPFSWKALGVDIRGRSRTLRVNYRTSHQIRTQADRLLGPVVTDVDGNSDDRSDTVSVFNGPPPTIQTLKSEDEEIKAVADWIAGHSKAGVMPQE